MRKAQPCNTGTLQPTTVAVADYECHLRRYIRVLFWYLLRTPFALNPVWTDVWAHMPSCSFCFWMRNRAPCLKNKTRLAFQAHDCCQLKGSGSFKSKPLNNGFAAVPGHGLCGITWDAFHRDKKHPQNRNEGHFDFLYWDWFGTYLVWTTSGAIWLNVAVYTWCLLSMYKQSICKTQFFFFTVMHVPMWK